MDAPGKDGNVSMLEQVKRPDPWMKMMMIIQTIISTDREHSAGAQNKTYRFKHGCNVFWIKPCRKNLIVRKITHYL